MCGLDLEGQGGSVDASSGLLEVCGEERLGFRLVGKLLANKLVNRDAFINFSSALWGTMEGVEIEVAIGNTFSFKFKNANDRRQLLLEGPWSFDKALLALEEPIRKGDIQQMKFNKAIL
ncbi:hypothetical protein Ddye_004699 [Dipteronia dyeriana]|uniref:DUF4283 domain-containing protein n=1 Tax=Dipteronia dyeriana TaxID=168575 RepID=A0AAE0CP02_9ROSI|nr:hypothetical protein Ddye_004699 [Dipteronia dyeriana]